MINYEKEAKLVIDKYEDKFHVIFRDRKEAEDLVKVAIMTGYNLGLDFTLNQKPIK